MEILISLSAALIGGLLLSRVAKRLKLPAVTAYLVAGLLLGPFCLGALGAGGLGFPSMEAVERLNILSQVALGFIAFTIGNEFRVSQLKAMGRQAIIVGILQAVTATVLLDLALILLHLIRPEVISVSSAITLGVVLFSASFGVAMALESGTVSVVTVLVEPVVEIVLSLGLGALAGVALYWVEQFFHSRSKRLTISIGFVLLTVGLSMKEFEVGGVHCGFSLLLVCMMTGTLFCNICGFSEELMARVDGWTAPLFVLFFVLSGAELDLSVLRNPSVLLIGFIYILVRSLGKYVGAYGSCALSGCGGNITKYLGITLLPQAGVALGMAITAQALTDGAVVRSVVLFSVLVYELVGPALTKRALLAAGEIQPEGRTSARTKNA